MANCVIHLLNLASTTSIGAFVKSLDTEAQKSILIKGKPHGWVHEPRGLNLKQLTPNSGNRDVWDLFLLTTISFPTHALSRHSEVSAHLSVSISVPESQFIELTSRATSNARPAPAQETPPLPAKWFKSPGQGTIPLEEMVSVKQEPLRSGELLLHPPMVEYLSTALPSNIANEPVCYFNLFKYRNGDRSVHDAYMEGFKQNFGSAAGAGVLFMGPVEGALQVDGKEQEGRWDDANLVQYDSVWHYAYMLSTEVYQKLNKQKMDGLADTCILLVSEIELMHV